MTTTMTMSLKGDKTGLRRQRQSGRSQRSCLLRRGERGSLTGVQGRSGAGGTGCVSGRGYDRASGSEPAKQALGLVCHEGRWWQSRIQACICDQGTLMRGAASTPDFPASLKTAKL